MLGPQSNRLAESKLTSIVLLEDVLYSFLKTHITYFVQDIYLFTFIK